MCSSFMSTEILFGSIVTIKVVKDGKKGTYYLSIGIFKIWGV